MPVTYQPQYRVHGTTPWINFGSPLASTATGVSVTGLTSGTQYDFQVITIMDVGTATSSVYTVSTQAGTSESLEGFTVNTAGPIIYASQTNRVASTGPFNQFNLVVDPGGADFDLILNGTKLRSQTVNTGYHNHTRFENASDHTAYYAWQ